VTIEINVKARLIALVEDEHCSVDHEVTEEDLCDAGWVRVEQLARIGVLEGQLNLIEGVNQEINAKCNRLRKERDDARDALALWKGVHVDGARERTNALIEDLEAELALARKTRNAAQEASTAAVLARRKAEHECDRMRGISNILEDVIGGIAHWLNLDPEQLCEDPSTVQLPIQELRAELFERAEALDRLASLTLVPPLFDSATEAVLADARCQSCKAEEGLGNL